MSSKLTKVFTTINQVEKSQSYFAKVADVGIYGPRDELYIRMD